MKQHKNYQALLDRSLETLQLQHLARRFDFGSESRVAAILVQRINSCMDELEEGLGIVRVKPFELYANKNHRSVIFPLFRTEYLEPIFAGGTFSQSRKLVMEECLERLREAMPHAQRRDVLSVIDPWSLVKWKRDSRFRDQLVDDIRMPSEETDGDVAEMIDSIRPSLPTHRAGKLDFMIPESVASALTDFVVREAGLGPLVSRKLVEEVITLRNISCPRKENLRIGQMPLIVPHVRAHPSLETRTRFRRLTPVIITVYVPGEIKKHPPASPTLLRSLQRRMVRVCFEAYRQNGLLSHRDLQWIFQLNPNRISELLRSFQKEHAIIVPTPGTVLDMGRSITHKDIVINLHLQGYTLTEIAKQTYHSPLAVNSYITTFESVLILYLYRLPPHLMAHLLKRRIGLITEHLKLLEQAFGNAESIRDFLREKGVKIPTIAS